MNRLNKANGRLRPASKKEVAAVEERIYTCEKCGKTISSKDIQFGENVKCPCGGEYV